MAPFESWRLLITPACSGARNMAIDQALLELYAITRRPTLRLYRWQPPCVSIGVGQRLRRDVNVDACAARGIEIVRRSTGGRAILHDQEVTYALIIAAEHPLVDHGSIVQSYRAISAALCHGLDLLGVAAALAPRPSTHAPKSAACFDQPGDYEITLRNRKLIGSAQARQGGVVLQHGSLLLHADADLLASVLRLPPELDGVALRQRLIALDQILDVPPSFDQVTAALVQGFEQTWSIRLTTADLTPTERERAAALVREKFGNLEWTERR